MAAHYGTCQGRTKAGNQCRVPVNTKEVRLRAARWWCVRRLGGGWTHMPCVVAGGQHSYCMFHLKAALEDARNKRPALANVRSRQLQLGTMAAAKQSLRNRQAVRNLSSGVYALREKKSGDIAHRGKEHMGKRLAAGACHYAMRSDTRDSAGCSRAVRWVAQLYLSARACPV